MDISAGLRKMILRNKMSRKRKCLTSPVDTRQDVQKFHKAEVLNYLDLDTFIKLQTPQQHTESIQVPDVSANSYNNEPSLNGKIGFLDLPTEIRQLIYEHYFGGWTLKVFDLGSAHTPLVNLPNMNLLLTTRAVHQEAKQMLDLAFRGCAEILHLGPGGSLELGKYKWLRSRIRSIKIDDLSWDVISRFDDSLKWPSLQRIELFARFRPHFIVMDVVETPASAAERLHKSKILQNAEIWFKEFKRTSKNWEKIGLEVRQRYWIRKFMSTSTTPFYLETIVEFREEHRKLISRKLCIDPEKERAESASFVDDLI